MKTPDWVKKVIYGPRLYELDKLKQEQEQPKKSAEPVSEELMELARKAIESAVASQKLSVIRSIEDQIHHQNIFSHSQRLELGNLIEDLQRTRKLQNAQTLFTAVICGASEEAIEDRQFGASSLSVSNPFMNAAQSASIQNMRPGQIISNKF